MSDKEGGEAGSSGSSSASLSKSQKLNYEQLYEHIKGKPCRVVRLERAYEEKGREMRTKPHIVDRELEQVMRATTLEEIHTALDTVGTALEQLDIFRSIDMLVTEEPEDQPDACTVVVDLEEKNWYKVHAATYVHGNEGSMEAGIGLHNVSGHAEHVVLSGEYGNRQSNQFALVYTQPRIRGLPLTLEARLQKYFRNNQLYSSYTEQLRGGSVGLRSTDGHHSVSYELGWRHLADPTLSASRAVLAQTGDYLRSALRYAYLLDHRDNPVVPGDGWALRAASELGGLSPDNASRAVKQQLDVQWARPISDNLSFCVTLSTGLMLPYGPGASRRSTSITDRFFLGGPSNLRGFQLCGAGPSDERRPRRATGEPGAAPGETPRGGGASSGGRDALGGDLYASLMAALNFKLPHPALQALRLHGHAFLNGGSSVLLTGNGKGYGANLREFGTSLRWSVGAGLVLPTPFGRFEINYAWVLSHQPYDRLQAGIQLGFASSPFSALGSSLVAAFSKAIRNLLPTGSPAAKLFAMVWRYFFGSASPASMAAAQAEAAPAMKEAATASAMEEAVAGSSETLVASAMEDDSATALQGVATDNVTPASIIETSLPDTTTFVPEAPTPVAPTAAMVADVQEEPAVIGAADSQPAKSCNVPSSVSGSAVAVGYDDGGDDLVNKTSDTTPAAGGKVAPSPSAAEKTLKPAPAKEEADCDLQNECDQQEGAVPAADNAATAAAGHASAKKKGNKSGGGNKKASSVKQRNRAAFAAALLAKHKELPNRLVSGGTARGKA